MADVELMKVVDDLVDRNTNGIHNLSELARRLSTLEARRNAESWRKDLRRWRTGNYKEADIALVARAFGIPRERLPAAKTKTTIAALDRRLSALEATVGLVDERETVGNLLDELAEKVALLQERVLTLEASSDYGGASPTVTHG